MTDLAAKLADVLCDRFTANATRVQELAAPLSNEQFWKKPLPFGNSFGHLVLHLTGNLNYYIGAQIAQTGYVRERPREFSEANPPSKEKALEHLDEAVAMVMATIRAQHPEDWGAAYSAVGTPASNRLAMVVRCAAHMQHHIGQMVYLAYALAS